MIFLRACPKCQGDLSPSGWDADDASCIQCGYVRYGFVKKHKKLIAK